MSSAPSSMADVLDPGMPRENMGPKDPIAAGVVSRLGNRDALDYAGAHLLAALVHALLNEIGEE